MLVGGEWRKYSISKRTHGGKWKCFFLSFSFIVEKSRRDETRERWRNRFSHSISHKIQLWARLISSRLPLIDITFSTSIFSSTFMILFIVCRRRSFKRSLLLIERTNINNKLLSSSSSLLLLLPSSFHSSIYSLGNHPQQILQLKSRNLTVNRISSIYYY